MVRAAWTRACRGIFGALVAVGMAGAAWAGDKSDLVTLRNGDVLHGDIKGLVHGVLEFKTDSMSTVEVRWEDVVGLTSQYTFQFEVTGGARYLGQLLPSALVGLLLVKSGSDVVELSMYDVVTIRSIAEGFLDRLDGYVKLGFSFTKASDVAQLTLQSQVIYKEEKYRVQLDLSTITTSQAEAPTTTRSEAILSYIRLLPNRNFALGLGGFQRNDELGIQLRTLLGGGFGRVLAQGEHMAVSLVGGTVLNHEQPTGSDEATLNLEALLRADYKVYYLRSPKFSVDAILMAYPGITDFGRIRASLDVTLRKEIISDFTIDLTFFANYDNRPPGEAVSTSDYGIVTSLGYSF